MIAGFFLIFFIFSTSEAFADIYRYVSEDGVECFTDSPSDQGAILIIREPAPARKIIPNKGVRKPERKNLTTPRMATRGGEAGASSQEASLPVQGRITSLVGMRSDPFDGVFRFHKGVDIAIPVGTPIKPVAAGRIVYSGDEPGHGKMIIVQHQDGMRTVYAHNSLNMAASGEEAGRDTVIALSGSTGRSTGPHLHFEAWREGVNVTSSFSGEGDAGQLKTTYREISHKKNRIRRAILADGSLLFTNLP